MPDDWIKRHQAGDAAGQDPDGYAGAILKRPDLYTLNGTLEEVLCYLDGYYDCMTHHEAAGSTRAQREYWDFLTWLKGQLPGPLESHHDLVRAVRTRHPEDSAALGYLAGEYDAYWSSLKVEEAAVP